MTDRPHPPAALCEFVGVQARLLAEVTCVLWAGEGKLDEPVDRQVAELTEALKAGAARCRRAW